VPNPFDILSERLDQWVQAGGVSVTENAGRVVVRRLSGAQATELLSLVDEAGLPVLELRDQGGAFERAELDSGMDRIQVQTALPAAPDGVERILTLSAFSDALGRPELPSQVWVRRLDAAFETLTVRFGPWDDGRRETPVESCVDPRRVMRPLGRYPMTDSDLCRWLLIDESGQGAAETPAYVVWRIRAAAAIARALANEIDPEDRLLFRGPPVSRFTIDDREDIGQEGFLALQRAGRWTYRNAHELEQRHGLMSAEIARTALRSGDLSALAQAVGPALEGARIAYGFGIQQQSRETLKALSDLRKAVLDETAKLTEINRGLATAVGGAVLGGVGLLVARLTLPSNGVFIGWAALLLGGVLILHVAATIISGVMFVGLQKRLRAQWRTRLYAFLSEDDYRALVKTPVGEAERGFTIMAWAGGAITVLVAIASAIIFLARPMLATEAEKAMATMEIDESFVPVAPKPQAQAGTIMPVPEKSSDGTSAVKIDKGTKLTQSEDGAIKPQTTVPATPPQPGHEVDRR